jgi:hypothetical protein
MICALSLADYPHGKTREKNVLDKKFSYFPSLLLDVWLVVECVMYLDGVIDRKAGVIRPEPVSAEGEDTLGDGPGIHYPLPVRPLFPDQSYVGKQGQQLSLLCGPRALNPIDYRIGVLQYQDQLVATVANQPRASPVAGLTKYGAGNAPIRLFFFTHRMEHLEKWLLGTWIRPI